MFAKVTLEIFSNAVLVAPAAQYVCAFIVPENKDNKIINMENLLNKFKDLMKVIFDCIKFGLVVNIQKI